MTQLQEQNGLNGRTATLKARIVADLRQQIEGGALTPGHQLPPILSLCERYGVSDITVRAALKELTTHGYIESRRGSGIFVKGTRESTPSLTGEKTLALLLGAWDSPFFAGIIRGVEDQCRRAGYRCVLASSGYDEHLEAQYLQELSDQVAGLMVMPLMGNRNYAAYTALLSKRTSFVFIDSYKEGLAAPLVATDNEKGGYLATRHLLGTTRRVYALCGQEHTSFQERLQGYRRAYKEAGIAFDASLMRASHHRPAEAGYELTQEILREIPRRKLKTEPIGLFCFNDVMARGAYVAVKEAGLDIPDAVAIVGYDDNDAAYFDPPLSSVRQDTHELGVTAVRLLLETMRSGASRRPRTVRLQPELVIRSSSDARSTFSAAGHMAAELRRRNTEMAHNATAPVLSAA